MGFASDRAAPEGAKGKTRLGTAAVLAATAALCGFAQVAAAMPTSRYESYFEERWPLEHAFYQPTLPAPMAASFDGLADRLFGRGVDLDSIAGRSDHLALTRHDRATLDDLLQKAREASVAGIRASSARDLYREAERDIHRFYSESADEGLWTREAASFGLSVSNSGADFFAEPGEARTHDPAQTELEAVGRELLKPAQQMRLFMQSAADELKRFILLQEPRSTQTVLVDGHNGEALFLAVEAVEPRSDEERLSAVEPAAGVPNPLVQPLDPGQRPQRREWPPLHLALWHLLTSDIFFMLYGIIGLCWASWRYIISRYA